MSPDTPAPMSAVVIVQREPLHRFSVHMSVNCLNLWLCTRDTEEQAEKTAEFIREALAAARREGYEEGWINALSAFRVRLVMEQNTWKKAYPNQYGDHCTTKLIRELDSIVCPTEAADTTTKQEGS